MTWATLHRMNVSEDIQYREKLEAEGRFWDREFLKPETTNVFPCVFHASPFFREALTRPLLRRVTQNLGPNSMVLDLGCGQGWLTRLLAETGAEARGVDIAGECLLRASEKSREAGLTNCSFDRFDANTGTLPSSAYDWIVSWGTLHHLANMEHAIMQIAKALKPDGRLALLECVEQTGIRGRLAHGLADLIHLILPTDRSYIQKIRQGFSKLTGGKQEFEWSPFENVGGGSWQKEAMKHFEIVEHEEMLCFMSPFAARVRNSRGMRNLILSMLYGLDRTLIRFRILPAEYHFMILKKKD